MTGKIWFISGATSGFGKHIGLEALSRGDSVIATSRTATSKLSSTEFGSSPNALLIDLDVTASDAEITSAFEQGVARFGEINIFVNAAGYILEGPVEGATADDIAKTFNVNVIGNMNLSRHEVALLRKQGRGGVIANFGSLASWGGNAGFAYYASTKWAVSGFTEALHAEVKPFGISAVVVEPGYFRTGFLNPAGGNRLFVSNALTEEYKGTGVEYVRNLLNEVDNKQPGDVVKGSKIIVDTLTRTGVAQGKEIPVRLPLGADIIKGIRDKISSTEGLLDEWEEIVSSTDHDDVI